MKPIKLAKKAKRSGRNSAANPSAKWQIQTAKARFSELIRQARIQGPQIVTKQGRDEVVVLPIEQYKELKAAKRNPKSLVRFFAESPLAEVELDLTREPDYGRDVEL